MIASLTLAVVFGVIFVARARRHPAPVLELGLFRAPAFALAATATFLFFAGFAAFLLGGVLFLTDVWGYSTLEAGFAFAPGPALAAVFAVISGRLADRLGPAVIGAPGGLLFALGTTWFIGLGPEPDYLAEYLPGMLIGGAGVGLILPSFTAAATMTLPAARLATGRRRDDLPPDWSCPRRRGVDRAGGNPFGGRGARRLRPWVRLHGGLLGRRRPDHARAGRDLAPTRRVPSRSSEPGGGMSIHPAPESMRPPASGSVTPTGYRLILAAAGLSLAHHLDHVLRDATGWPLTGGPNAFTYSLLVYPAIAVAVMLSRRGKAGPRFWTIFSGVAALFILAVHLGPVAADSVAAIPRQYSSSAAGATAIVLLAAFLAMLVVTSVYEAGQARRRARADTASKRRWKVLIGIVALLALLLIPNAISVDNETRPAGITTAGGAILELPGGDVQVVDVGSKRPSRGAAPIVLIHCYTCSLHWWDRMVPRLSERHRVIRIDLLGFGGSEKPESGYSIEEQGRLVAAALHRLGVREAVVVGHSTGFDVGTALAQHAGDLVDGLVDIGEASDNSLLSLPFIAKLGYAPVIGEATWRITPSSAIKDGYQSVFAPGYDLESGFKNPDQVVEDFRAMTYTSFDLSKAAQAAFVEDLPLEERVRAAAVPLLVIFGERDQTWANPAAAAEAYRDVSGARIEMLPGAGHSPNVEQPEQTARLILEFAEEGGGEPITPARRALFQEEPLKGARPRRDGT